jgi:hypothetical protein
MKSAFLTDGIDVHNSFAVGTAAHFPPHQGHFMVVRFRFDSHWIEVNKLLSIILCEKR